MAPPAAVNTQHSHSYLTDSLPREIRDQIYEYVLVFDVKLLRPFWDHVDPNGKLCKHGAAQLSESHWTYLSERMPSFGRADRDTVLSNRKRVPIDLLLVNRRMNTEATRIFLGKNLFTLHPLDLALRHLALPIFNPVELSLMTNVILQLEMGGFHHVCGRPPLNGHVIGPFIKSLKGRTNVKILEIVISHICMFPHDCETEFLKVMSPFAHIRNIKSVAFILLDKRLLLRGREKDFTWSDAIVDSTTFRGSKKIQPFLDNLIKQMTAPASVCDSDPDVGAGSEDCLSIGIKALEFLETT